MWGPRQPVVVSKEWNRGDVKVEIMTAEAAKGAVARGLMYCGRKRTVHMAIGGRGASITRQTQGTSGRQVSPRLVVGWPPVGPHPRAVGITIRRPLVGACFRCWKTGHWKDKFPDRGWVDMRGVLRVDGEGTSVRIARDGCGWPCRRLGAIRTRPGWNKDRRRGGWDQIRGGGLRRPKTCLTTPKVWRR